MVQLSSVWNFGVSHLGEHHWETPVELPLFLGEWNHLAQGLQSHEWSIMQHWQDFQNILKHLIFTSFIPFIFLVALGERYFSHFIDKENEAQRNVQKGSMVTKGGVFFLFFYLPWQKRCGFAANKVCTWFILLFSMKLSPDWGLKRLSPQNCNDKIRSK